MQTTADLLDHALQVMTPPEWARKLGLHRDAMHNAKKRNHIAPAMAGAIAEQLGEDVDRWIVIAALESEKDSACKDRMLKRVSTWRKRCLSIIVRKTSRAARRGRRSF